MTKRKPLATMLEALRHPGSGVSCPKILAAPEVANQRCQNGRVRITSRV